ncbi:MAG: type II toxin-antitoxin system RelE/ParE family toxin [Pirellulales bacterium]
MDRRLRYHPLFDCDVREAAAWYDRRSSGLGEIFTNQVESRIADVIGDPNRFARTPTGCRYVRIPRFPYIVLFEVADDEVIFLGVMHTARSVEKWRERETDD